MNNNVIEYAKNTIQDIDVLLKKCRTEIDDFETTHQYYNESRYINTINTIVEKAEKIALKTRELPLSLGVPLETLDITDTVADAIDFHAGFTDRGWFVMRIPPLVKKKYFKGSTYLGHTIYRLLFRYFEKHRDINPTKYEDCDIVFVNMIERESSYYQVRDNDNLEYNHVTNALATYFLPDDGPLYCNHHHYSIIGDTNCTYVYLVPHKDFSLFLYEYDNGNVCCDF